MKATVMKAVEEYFLVMLSMIALIGIRFCYLKKAKGPLLIN